MKVSASHKNARVTPRKARQWRGVLMGKTVADARAQLAWLPGKPVRLMAKILNSAVANAVNNYQLEEKNLVVSNVEINEGIKFKRWQPVSRGIAHPYRKDTAHIKVVVEDRSSRKKAKGVKTKIETLSADRFNKLKKPEKREEVKAMPGQKVEPTDTGEERVDKSMKIWNKERMLQKGGDKKQTHRRKSK